jgi:prepilin-type processing-associated H-X9-DG protein
MSFRHGAGPNYTDRQYYTSQAAYASAGGAVSNAAFYDGSVRAVKISEITYEMLYPELAK